MARSANVWKWNDEGVRDLLSRTDVAIECTKSAEEIQTRAHAFAPESTGAYRRSLDVKKTTSQHIGLTRLFDRPVWQVIADVPHAGKVEVTHRVLGKAAGL